MSFIDGTFLETPILSLNVKIERSGNQTPTQTPRPTGKPELVKIVKPDNNDTVTITFKDIPGKSKLNGTLYSNLTVYAERSSFNPLKSADLMVCKNGTWYSLGINDTTDYPDKVCKNLIYNWNLSNFDIGEYEILKLKITDVDGKFHYSNPKEYKISRAEWKPTPVNTPTPSSTPALPTGVLAEPIVFCGYISPDFLQSSWVSNERSGFKVEFDGLKGYAYTDINGYFNLSLNQVYYIRLKISKPGFLTRVVDNVPFKNCKIGTMNKPVVIMSGDVSTKSRSADGSINMSDIVAISSLFNVENSSERFNPEYDLNMDNSINMTDIMLAAKNFGKTIDSYNMPYVTPETKPTVSFVKPADNTEATSGSDIDIEVSAIDNEDDINRVRLLSYIFNSSSKTLFISPYKTSYTLPSLFSNYTCDRVPYQIEAYALDEAQFSGNTTKTIYIKKPDSPLTSPPTPTSTPTPANNNPEEITIVNTTLAENITSNSAELKSYISLRNNQVLITYEYWPANDPNNKHTAISSNYTASDRIRSITDTLTVYRLKPGTKYIYRTVFYAKSNGIGPYTYLSDEKTFETTAGPLTPSPTPTPTPTPIPTNELPMYFARASTLDAENITSDSAILKADVQSNYTEISISFEYWETQYPAAKNILKGNRYLTEDPLITNDSVGVSGLKPDTDYSYRTVYSSRISYSGDAFEIHYCEVKNFKTKVQSHPPSPTRSPNDMPKYFVDVKTLDADNITFDSASLRSDILLRGKKLYVSYEYWETHYPNVRTTIKSNDYNGDTPLITVDAFTIKGLKPSTNYSFRTVYYTDNFDPESGMICDLKTFDTKAKPLPTPVPTELPMYAAKASTLAADYITYNSALLMSDVHLRGTKLSVFYEYWENDYPEEKFHIESNTYSAGDSPLFTIDTVTIDNLKSGSHYKYRAAYSARNGNGVTETHYGKTKDFTTKVNTNPTPTKRPTPKRTPTPDPAQAATQTPYSAGSTKTPDASKVSYTPAKFGSFVNIRANTTNPSHEYLETGSSRASATVKSKTYSSASEPLVRTDELEVTGLKPRTNYTCRTVYQELKTRRIPIRFTSAEKKFMTWFNALE